MAEPEVFTNCPEIRPRLQPRKLVCGRRSGALTIGAEEYMGHADSPLRSISIFVLRETCPQLGAIRLRRLIPHHEVHQFEQSLSNRPVLAVESSRICFADEDLVIDAASQDLALLQRGQRAAEQLLSLADDLLHSSCGQDDAVTAEPTGSRRIECEQRSASEREMRQRFAPDGRP